MLDTIFILALFFAAWGIFHAVNWLHEMLFGNDGEACPECGHDDIRIVGSGQGMRSKLCADCKTTWGRK